MEPTTTVEISKHEAVAGDEVQLRWTGYEPVPMWLNRSWCKVVGRGTKRIKVQPVPCDEKYIISVRTNQIFAARRPVPKA